MGNAILGIKLSNNEALKKRFIKDMNLPINLLDTDYFMDRIQLFEAYNEFISYIDMIIDRFGGNAQDYLEYYNSVKDKAIEYIKNSAAYNDLNAVDMNKFAKKYNFSGRDVYKEPNVGKHFISIDMRKANFTALVHYGKTYGKEFFEDYSYEGFISQFTDIEHIINSKYIRQVIFGNCNPKRQITYESFLMERFFEETKLIDIAGKENIYALLSDELIICADGLDQAVIDKIEDLCDGWKEFPVKYETFTLGRIRGSQAYMKQFNDGSVTFKCVNPDEAPFIYRFIKHQDPKPSDYMFTYNGKLARFMDGLELSISYTPEESKAQKP